MDSTDNDDKSRPPVLVRREKRSSSTPRSPDRTQTQLPSPPSTVVSDDVTSGSPPGGERMQHVYPDVIIVERSRAGKVEVSLSGKQSPLRRSTEDKLQMERQLCDSTDATEDESSQSLKNYTYMFKKDDDFESIVMSDKSAVDAVEQSADAASDISSVSSSIVDYVRRSLSEVGASTTSGQSRDDLPPPLPAKTATQRCAPLHCDMRTLQVVPDNAVAQNWEPTHMTWDEVLNEAQMLGIPLHRSSPSRTRSNSERRSSLTSSHRSSPASSPAKSFTIMPEHGRRTRGSSTPSRLDRDPSDSRRESKRTNKFNIRNLLAKIAAGRTSPTTTTTTTGGQRQHQLSVSCDRPSLAMNPGLTRRSLSQPEQRHNKRSLSASASLRRARINDSTSSISGVSTISQYYPTAVAAQRSSPSPCRSAAAARCRRSPAPPGVRVATSLRSSAGSVWTAPDSLPDSVSTNSLGSVFSLVSSSTGASPALWTPITPRSGSPGCSTQRSGGQQVHGASRRHASASPSHDTTSRHLANNVDQLKNCGWYWGAIGWEEAEKALATEPDGSFLLRDSSDDRYLFSLSFRALDTTHHTRIEHYKGSFSFSAQTLHGTSSAPVAASSIVDFIQQAVIESHRCIDGQPVFSLQPRPPKLNAIPVRLLYPVSRFSREVVEA